MELRSRVDERTCSQDRGIKKQSEMLPCGSESFICLLSAKKGPLKLLHTTKLTYTNNGCSAPNAGLQLSCPMCMASLCEPNICCTSASKPNAQVAHV